MGKLSIKFEFTNCPSKIEMFVIVSVMVTFSTCCKVVYFASSFLVVVALLVALITRHPKACSTFWFALLPWACSILSPIDVMTHPSDQFEVHMVRVFTTHAREGEVRRRAAAQSLTEWKDYVIYGCLGSELFLPKRVLLISYKSGSTRLPDTSVEAPLGK